MKRLILNARGGTNSSVGRAAPLVRHLVTRPSLPLSLSPFLPRIRITTPFQRIVTVNRFDCFRIDSPLDSVPLIYRRMFAHRPGQKRFSTFARSSVFPSPADTILDPRNRYTLACRFIEFLIENGNRFDLLRAFLSLFFHRPPLRFAVTNFFPLPLGFLENAVLDFFSSLSILFFPFFRARDAQFRIHTRAHIRIDRRRTIVRSIQFFLPYLRYEYVACSVIAVRVHSSFEVEIGSTIFRFHPPLFSRPIISRNSFFTPHCFIYIPPFIHSRVEFLYLLSSRNKVKLITDNSQRE